MPLDALALHKLIEACLRDRMRARAYAADPVLIRRCLGLEPLPARTELSAHLVAREQIDDWLRKSYTFESIPGLGVPLLAYAPAGKGPFSLVVLAADSWPNGRREPWAQALGIALALHGLATVILEPPGTADRTGLGDPYDRSLASSITPQGVYVWDIMRAIDLAVAELGCQGEKVGLIGIGIGGEAAIFTAAIDTRIAALAVAGAGHHQDSGLNERYRQLPGVAEIGDWASLIAHRAPMPSLFLAPNEDDPDAIEATAKSLAGVYKKGADKLRVERFLGGRDLTRRMRESAAAFFDQHLRGAPSKPYLSELLPLTDGIANPRPANTADPADLVVDFDSGLTFPSLRDTALDSPYPEQEPALVPWGKYGRLDPIPDGEHLKIVDHGESPSVIALPNVDPSLLVPLGLGVPDFFAQLLHLLLPGAPEGWEPLGLQGDALTAMIASVRTLVKGAEQRPAPKTIEAEGPVASATARLLQLMRPSLEISVTHEARSWREMLDQGVLVPAARYRKWPWPTPAEAHVVESGDGQEEA